MSKRTRSSRQKSGRTHRIYVGKLKKTVLRSSTFRKENLGYIKGKPCVYVGSTEKRPEERWDQHLAGGKLSSPWVRKYGKELFPWAYEDLPTYAVREEAERAEKEHAEYLRSLGWGVWQN